MNDLITFDIHVYVTNKTLLHALLLSYIYFPHLISIMCGIYMLTLTVIGGFKKECCCCCCHLRVSEV